MENWSGGTTQLAMLHDAIGQARQRGLSVACTATRFRTPLKGAISSGAVEMEQRCPLPPPGDCRSRVRCRWGVRRAEMSPGV